jgi:hypothetical protein
LLPWPETGVQGLELTKKEAVWAPTLEPSSDQAQTERKASLSLTDTGDLEGKLTVTYAGLEAANLRREERNADETERRPYLEELVKGYIPVSSEAKLTNAPEWKNSALPLIAEFNLRVPGWASAAGRHVAVPAGLFSAHEKHIFDHTARSYPIYFDYPYSVTEDINIQIPSGWQVSSLPKGWQNAGRVVAYNLAAQNNNGILRLSRSLAVQFIILPAQYYGAPRSFYQEIKTTDDQQIILDPGAARAGNP